MSEFQPVETVEDLNSLDDDEMLAGYRHGLSDGAEPGSDKSRSFWHGWRNGAVDSKRKEIDGHQMRLAEAIYGPSRRTGTN